VVLQDYTLDLKYFKTGLIHKIIASTDVIENNAICDVCAVNMEPLFHIKNKANESILEKHICPKCTYVQFTKLPPREWLSDYYRSQWDKTRSSPKKFNSAQKTYAKNLSLIKQYSVPNPKLLDIGVGYGNFLREARVEGLEYLFGLEASERRAFYCRDELGLNVFLNDAEKVMDQNTLVQNAPFDVIHSHHVFEHLYDIKQVLKNCYQLLKENGIIALFVPNIIKENIFYISHGIIHVRNFSVLSLVTLLEYYGFKVLYVDHDLSIVAQKKSEPSNSSFIQDPLSEREQFRQQWLEKIKNEFRSSGNGVVWYGSNKTPANAIAWKIKQKLYGTYSENNPIFGQGGKTTRLISVKNVMRKIGQKMYQFDRFEAGAQMSVIARDSKNACNFPLVSFRYPKQKVVALIK